MLVFSFTAHTLVRSQTYWRHWVKFSLVILYLTLIFDWVNIAHLEFYFEPTFHLCFMFVFIILSCLFLQLCEHLPGADLLALFSVIFLWFLSLSHMVSQVRCGTWLYQSLIFAFFFTFCSCHWSFLFWLSISILIKYITVIKHHIS